MLAERIRVKKPDKPRESALMIAHVATRELKGMNEHDASKKVARSIYGNTSVEKAYDITSVYIVWENKHDCY